MKFRIKHISYLLGNQREIVKCSIKGKFLLKRDYDPFSKSSSSVSAYNFVTAPNIKGLDPVLTLHNGDKMRVYFGGDPKNMVVETQSIIEVHDEQVKQMEEERVKKTLEKSKESDKEDTSDSTGLFAGIDIFEDLHGW